MVPGVATLGQRQVTMVINKGHFSVLLPTYWDPKVHKSQLLVLGKLGSGRGPIFKVVLEC